MYEQSSHSKPSLTNMLLASNSRSHLLPQGGYTGGGGTLMAPSKTIARRPGQNTQSGQVGCSLVWTCWNTIWQYIRQCAMHVAHVFVCTAALATPRSGQHPHTLEASWQMSTNHACRRLIEIIQRILLKTHNSTFCTCHQNLNIYTLALRPG